MDVEAVDAHMLVEKYTVSAKLLRDQSLVSLQSKLQFTRYKFNVVFGTASAHDDIISIETAIDNHLGKCSCKYVSMLHRAY
jgi:hypothetical protein